MATNQGKNRNELVQCENCGEYYSVTYRQCPFCDEYEQDWEPEEGAEPRRGGGKRLVTNTRGGGYGRGWTPLRIIITALSIAVIIAAGCIVFSFIKPLIDRGKVEPPLDSPTPPPATESVLPTPATDDPLLPTEPGTTPGIDPGVVVTPAPTPSKIPSTQTANSFTINKSDFTLGKVGETYRIKTTFSPAGSTGFVDWSSSDPAVATVAADGTVTAVSRGSVTITATMAGGLKHTCIVRCSFSGGGAAPSAAPSATPGASGTLSLNRTDFTLGKAGETFRMKLSGTDSAVSWATSNAAIVTVGADGLVTAVGEGSCTVTAKVDGQSLSCIVRVNYN